MQNLKTFFFIHKQSSVKTSGGQIKAECNLFAELLMLAIEHEVNVKKKKHFLIQGVLFPRLLPLQMNWLLKQINLS